MVAKCHSAGLRGEQNVVQVSGMLAGEMGVLIEALLWLRYGAVVIAMSSGTENRSVGFAVWQVLR